jgi:hypothetical protein
MLIVLIKEFRLLGFILKPNFLSSFTYPLSITAQTPAQHTKRA